MNKAVIGIIIVICIIVGAVVLTGSNDSQSDSDGFSDEDAMTIYASGGEVAAKSSDLTLSYDNDLSGYDYIYNGENKGEVYNNQAVLKGTIKIDLSKVKWDDNYTVRNESYRLDDGPLRRDINNNSYVKENLIDSFNGCPEDVSAIIYFYDSDGEVAGMDSVSDDDGYINVTSIEDGIVTLDVYRDYEDKNMEYEEGGYGSYTHNQMGYDEASKAELQLHFEHGDLDCYVTCYLTGDEFNVVHM